MSERDRIDPNEGLKPPIPPAVKAEMRAEARRAHVEGNLDLGAVLLQALVALVAGAAAGGYAEPTTGAAVGMVGFGFGLVAGWALSNLVLLVAAPAAIAQLLPRLLARNPERLEPLDPNAGRFTWQLSIFACNFTLYVTAALCAAFVALDDAVAFLPSFAAFAVAAFLTSLFTRRARNVVI